MDNIDISPLFSIPVMKTNLLELNHDNLLDKIKKIEYVNVGSNNALMSKSDQI